MTVRFQTLAPKTEARRPRAPYCVKAGPGPNTQARVWNPGCCHGRQNHATGSSYLKGASDVCDTTGLRFGADALSAALSARPWLDILALFLCCAAPRPMPRFSNGS